MADRQKLYENPQGPGDARPTALHIVQEEGLTNKLKDKVFLITGCTSGIGVETARALYTTGAKIFITARDVKRGEVVARQIDSNSDNKVEVLQLELDSLDSVRQGANEFLKRSRTLNVLVCNAGVMATPEGRTKDGFETQFGTCHLGHFLLFQLLKSTLLSSSTKEFSSRVVCVSSLGHRSGGVSFGDYNFEKSGYQPWKAYGQAKTANIYMANEIERRYGSKGLHANSLHPGGIATNLQVHVQDMMKKFESNPEVMRTIMSTEQGAATTVWAAIGKEWEDKGGKYLENCSVSGPVKPEHRQGVNPGPGYAEHAFDVDAAKRLYEESLQMVSVNE
ncbi:WW domain-containing oxidoreductase [Acrasis kona]|uniref:WW domain-containing oxidoreductase n=1 Tax=Acrasis kona TaxID=1008807 RepID=A0AAW2ZH56_9EUKA